MQTIWLTNRSSCAWRIRPEHAAGDASLI